MEINKDFKNKKVLIIGNTGFKGSWLTIAMLKLGAKVYGISKDIPTVPSFFKIAKLEKKIDNYKLDIRNIEKLELIIKKIKPDFIFHLAAQSLVLDSLINPRLTFETNIMGTINVLECIRKIKHKCIAIIVTSDKCYLNIEKKSPYKENDRLGGKDPYSASKASAEVIFSCYVESYFKKIKNIKIASARAGNVIGGGDWSANRIVPDIIKSYLYKKKLFIRSPNSTRPWQHVLEPIFGYIYLASELSNKYSKSNLQSFNFAPYQFKNISVKQMIDKIKKTWPVINPSYKKEKNNSIESKLLQLNPNKSKKYLGWRSVLNLDETINFTIDWYKKYFANADMYSYSKSQLDLYLKISNKKNYEKK